MRKKAVGLLGNAKGAAKPIPFVEDTCVPPENLADYITEFRALLDSHNLQYGMFGHVDAGVLHVRPALDLCDPKQVKFARNTAKNSLHPNYGVNYVTSNSYLIRKIASTRGKSVRH